jgi:hypothetical protein
LLYHDQDALNLLVSSRAGGWLELEHTWNVQVSCQLVKGCQPFCCKSHRYKQQCNKMLHSRMLHSVAPPPPASLQAWKVIAAWCGSSGAEGTHSYVPIYCR